MLNQKTIAIVLIISIAIAALNAATGGTLFELMGGVTVAADMSSLESGAPDLEPELLTKGQSRSANVGVPAIPMKAFDQVNLSTATKIPFLDASDTLQITANGQNLVLSGTAYGVDITKMRLDMVTAKEPTVSGTQVTLDVPGYTVNNKLPAIFSKSNKDYMINGLIAILDLKGSYIETKLKEMDEAQLKKLASGIFDGNATTAGAPTTVEPLVTIVRPNIFALNIAGLKNKATKESSGVLCYLVGGSQDPTVISATLTTALTGSAIASDAEAIAELTDAIRSVKPGYITIAKRKFHLDKQTGIAMIR